MTNNNKSDQIVVIGGGAAGMMAALTAAQSGAEVTLIERNAKLGRKLYITGKGRCNVTNHCQPDEVLRNTPRNAKFLYSSMRAFPPEQVERLFEGLGVPLKVERGNRVFPQSDKAADIIDALFFALRRAGVAVVQDRALEICVDDGTIIGVRCEHGVIPCKAVILASGGKSYPLTGSTGDGYEMATALGHSVVPLRGSLIPLESNDPCCKQMQGLALKNVSVRLLGSTGKTIYQEQGELLFTHFGLSGPLILSASAHLPDDCGAGFAVSIDLKPALDEKQLDARLLRDLEQKANANFSSVLSGLLPASMVPVVAGRIGVPLDLKAHDLRKEQRRALLRELKGFQVVLTGTRPIEEAIVTAGGIKTGEVDPKTMHSKKLQGLFFAGEILDVDAYTGGFNLQIAWATGHAAGLGAAAYTAKETEK